jgi:translation elongation factor EF-1alpha
MKRKKTATSGTSIRLSAHEKICAERMQTLIKTIDELRGDVKDLRSDMNKGKGVIAFLIILGALVGSILSILKFVK